MLKCILETRGDQLLAGRVFLSGEAEEAPTNLMLQIQNAAGVLFFGRPNIASIGRLVAVHDAPRNKFRLTPPRRDGILTLNFFAEEGRLSVDIEQKINCEFAIKREKRADTGLSGASFDDHLTAALLHTALSEEYGASSPPATNEERDALQRFFDIAFETSPNKALLTLFDHALRYGVTDFLYAKLPLVLLRRHAPTAALEVCGAALANKNTIEPVKDDLEHRFHRAITLEKLRRLRECLTDYIYVAAHTKKAEHLLAAGRCAYRIAHGDFGLLPASPGALPQALGFLRAAIHDDRTGEAAFLSAATAIAMGRLAEADAALTRCAETPCAAKASELRFRLALFEKRFEDAATHFSNLDDADADIAREQLIRTRTFHLDALSDHWIAESAETVSGTPLDQQIEEDANSRGVTHAHLAAVDQHNISRYALYHAGAIALDTAGDYTRRWNRLDLIQCKSQQCVRRDQRLVFATPRAASSALKATEARRSVCLISPKGAFPFGGAERFLLTCAEIYTRQGYDVSFFGFEPPAETYPYHYPTSFIDQSLPSIRNAILDLDPAFLHVVSGAIETVSAALRGYNVPIVKGLHFWSEVCRPKHIAERTGYAVGGLQPADPSVALILLNKGPLYVNSPFLRDLVAERFGVSPPMVPSVEIDTIDTNATPTLDLPPYALLLDGRASKGGHFVLDVAARLPDRTFVIVCPQTSRDAIEQAVVERRLTNVITLDRVDEVDGLIAGAQVVLVPSFDFLETFGRVPIEAALRGKPAIVADAGNLPHLTNNRSFVLPQSAAAWADCIERCYQEPLVAPEIPEFCKPEHVRPAMERLAPSAIQNVAAVLPNSLTAMATAKPILKTMADHIGAPIDVIVTGSFAEARRLFDDEHYAGAVMARSSIVSAKPYRVVVLLAETDVRRDGFFAEEVVDLSGSEGLNAILLAEAAELAANDIST